MIKKDYRTLGKPNFEEKEKRFSNDDVYVTRYVTVWNSDTRKMFTVISGDQLIVKGCAVA